MASSAAALRLLVSVLLLRLLVSCTCGQPVAYQYVQSPVKGSASILLNLWARWAAAVRAPPTSCTCCTPAAPSSAPSWCTPTPQWTLRSLQFSAPQVFLMQTLAVAVLSFV